MDPKPLQPLNSGIVLLVGVKASNFDDEIKSHPRIVMWDSQHEHWLNKDLPSNTRAVFMTRWIGHDAFVNIVKEARKRQITIFNPEGTGIIARQVRELLSIRTQTVVLPDIDVTEPDTKSVNTVKETEMAKGEKQNKLKILIPHIDFNKMNIDNAKILFARAQSLGIRTTVGSLAQMVSKLRSKQSKSVAAKPTPKTDVSVQMFDNVIKELSDMRDFIVATVNENNALKARIAAFKKALGE